MSAPEEKAITALRAEHDVPGLYRIHMTIKGLIVERDHARRLVIEMYPQTESETSCGPSERDLEIEALIEKWKREGLE